MHSSGSGALAFEIQSGIGWVGISGIIFTPSGGGKKGRR
jgi:hypothetical protein